MQAMEALAATVREVDPAEIRGCRRLASAVVLRAVGDATGQSITQKGTRKVEVSPKKQEEARAFLKGPGLDFWANVADLDPEKV